MEFIPVPYGMMGEMRYTQDQQKVENVFWFKAPEPQPSPSNLAAVGAILFNWWDDHLKTIQASACTLREIYVTDQSNQFGGMYTYSTNLPAAAASVQPPAPNSVTLCISLRTQQRGRSFRGRSYVIGLTNNIIVNSHVTPQGTSAWLNAYDALIAESGTAGYQLCICSRFTNKLPRAEGVLTEVVDAVLVDDTVDTQKGRLPGRGQ